MIDVLLVEDDLADVLMIEEAFASLPAPPRLHVATDGVEATAFLRREGMHARAPQPAFVLLDLNMPRKDGFEVLRELKSDAALSVIPVVVFSTSDEPQQIRRSYIERANAYVVKPMNVDEFMRVVREIEQFYAQIVTGPPHPRNEGRPAG
jgi:CheY-like chemotaxis protein